MRIFFFVFLYVRALASCPRQMTNVSLRLQKSSLRDKMMQRMEEEFLNEIPIEQLPLSLAGFCHFCLSSFLRYAICGMNDFIDNLANNSHHSKAIFIKSLTAKSSIVRCRTRTEFLMCANQFSKRAKLINLSFAFLRRSSKVK